MPKHVDASRRKFRIQSKFGGSRQWRSRKSRPCDACRKRKSACVIEDEPPCLFCKERGLDCQATIGPFHPNRAERSAAPSSGTSDHSSTEREQDALREEPAEATCNQADQNVTGIDFTSPVNSVESHQAPSRINVRAKRDTGTPCLEPDIPLRTDAPPKTAHLMGLSAEQDTHLLASFRSFIMDELDQVSGEIVSMSGGSTATGRPPVHFCVLHDAFMPWDNAVRQEASDKIESCVAPYGDDLVRLYFKHVHPVYCVLSKVRFLRAYKYEKLSIPASLRGVLYGLASVFWDQDDALKSVPRPFEQYELFHAAQASLERELDAPNLWKLQACLLMLHEQPAVNHTFQTPRTWTLSAQAVACAQMAGLHRDPTEWNLEPWEKSLRKKLFWATYMTDCWASVSHGNPPHIYPQSFTTIPATMDDLRMDEEVPEDLTSLVEPENAHFNVSTAARFLEQMQLTRILHDLLDLSFTDQSYQTGRLNPLEHETSLGGLRRQLNDWRSLVPNCVTMGYKSPDGQHNGALHLAYFAICVLLFRALMTPASMTAKRNPQSSLRRFFGQALEHLQALPDFMDQITIDMLRGFWGRHARAQLLLVGNFLELLFLLSSDPEEVKGSYALLERFHASLQRLTEMGNDDSMTLVRPVAIRIDSFFTQAAHMMRESTRAGSHLGSIILDTTP